MPHVTNLLFRNVRQPVDRRPCRDAAPCVTSPSETSLATQSRSQSSLYSEFGHQYLKVKVKPHLMCSIGAGSCYQQTVSFRTSNHFREALSHGSETPMHASYWYEQTPCLQYCCSLLNKGRHHRCGMLCTQEKQDLLHIGQFSGVGRRC